MPFPSKIDASRVTQVATELLERQGREAVSMRAIAGELGVVPNALYRYFPSRDALMASVADAGLEQLLAGLEQARLEASDRAALELIAQTYLAFARERPAVYALAMSAQPEAAHKEPAHAKLWQFVVGVLTEPLGEADAPRAAVALWSFLHGVVCLEASGLLGDGKPGDPAYGLSALLDGLLANPVKGSTMTNVP